jgi:probable rRNA maturation factor
MTLQMEIENASTEAVPDPQLMRHWVATALSAASRTGVEICVRIVSAEEGRNLNRIYRQRDYATNVLSFPADLPAELNLPLLGDLAICATVVAREAVEQGKAENAHWAHMLVHGTLHLLGYDHIDDDEAEQMEALETAILVDLGFAPPYEPSATHTASHSEAEKPQERPHNHVG